MASVKLSTVLLGLMAVCVYATETPKKLHCYTCNGDSCKEVNDKTHVAECNTKCYIFGDSKKESWDRGCVSGTEDFCKSKTDQSCSTCEEDKCNSASALGASALITVGVAMLLKYFH